MDINYIPEVIKVMPKEDYKVYIYFDDSSIKLYNAEDIINKGVFKALRDKKVFVESCTVINGTLAWDLEGNYDKSKCLDLDPIVLYTTCPNVAEPID